MDIVKIIEASGAAGPVIMILLVGLVLSLALFSYLIIVQKRSSTKNQIEMDKAKLEIEKARKATEDNSLVIKSNSDNTKELIDILREQNVTLTNKVSDLESKMGVMAEAMDKQVNITETYNQKFDKALEIFQKTILDSIDKFTAATKEQSNAISIQTDKIQLSLDKVTDYAMKQDSKYDLIAGKSNQIIDEIGALPDKVADRVNVNSKVNIETVNTRLLALEEEVKKLKPPITEVKPPNGSEG